VLVCTKEQVSSKRCGTKSHWLPHSIVADTNVRLEATANKWDFEVLAIKTLSQVSVKITSLNHNAMFSRLTGHGHSHSGLKGIRLNPTDVVLHNPSGVVLKTLEFF
jgi:hypothetical protein